MLTSSCQNEKQTFLTGTAFLLSMMVEASIFSFFRDGSIEWNVLCNLVLIFLLSRAMDLRNENSIEILSERLRTSTSNDLNWKCFLKYSHNQYSLVLPIMFSQSGFRCNLMDRILDQILFKNGQNKQTNIRFKYFLYQILYHDGILNSSHGECVT